MKSVLFFATCLFALSASAKYYNVVSLEDLKGADPLALAGQYKGENGDTALVEVVAVDKDGEATKKTNKIAGYDIDITYTKVLGLDVTVERWVTGSDLVKVSKKGSFTFSKETDCDDVECNFGTDEFVFYKKDGKYAMDAVIDYNTEENDGFGYQEEDDDGEPLPPPAEADILDYCETIYGPTATGSLEAFGVVCSVSFESRGLVQQ